MTTTDQALSTGTWMRRFADTVRSTQAQLTALDQQVGDGDFGTNLSAGTVAALTRLDALDALTPLDACGATGAAAALEAAATAFLDEVGGTSGPLFGLLLQSLAASVAELGLTTPALTRGVVKGLAAIRRVGVEHSARHPRNPARPRPRRRALQPPRPERAAATTWTWRTHGAPEGSCANVSYSPGQRGRLHADAHADDATGRESHGPAPGRARLPAERRRAERCCAT
ncbi:hypothetical protein SFUMM280S_04753 [Streptomyces fumanus]